MILSYSSTFEKVRKYFFPQENKIDFMSALLLSPSLGIKNVVKKQERCWCDYHNGDVVTQIEADLPNDIHFVIVKDKYYRLAIGVWDSDTPPPIVNPEKIEDMLLEALGG